MLKQNSSITTPTLLFPPFLSFFIYFSLYFFCLLVLWSELLLLSKLGLHFSYPPPWGRREETTSDWACRVAGRVALLLSSPRALNHFPHHNQVTPQIGTKGNTQLAFKAYIISKGLHCSPTDNRDNQNVSTMLVTWFAIKTLKINYWLIGAMYIYKKK